MKKKGTLPQDFQRMLKKLKRLDDELGISLSPSRKETEKKVRKEAKEKERKTLLDGIWQAWPRRTVLSKDVLQMRSNALKNPEVKTVLNKADSRIENCGLIDLRPERYIGEEWDCPADCSPKNIRRALTDERFCFNTWRVIHHYKWGHPKDSIKILFQRSANNRFKVVGIIQMFGEKAKKKAA
jgi:hypothetical protein